jgi:hypothetical protein
LAQAKNRLPLRGYAATSKTTPNGYGCNARRGLAPPFVTRAAAVNSTAAADGEFAIDCGVLIGQVLEIAGVL